MRFKTLVTKANKFMDREMTETEQKILFWLVCERFSKQESNELNKLIEEVKDTRKNAKIEELTEQINQLNESD